MTGSGPGPLVVDTHSAVWYLHQDARLSRRAELEIDLVDKGRIPAAVAERVDQVLRDPASGFRLVPATGQ